VVVAGGAVDRRAVAVLAPEPGFLARNAPRLLALLGGLALVALAAWLLTRRRGNGGRPAGPLTAPAPLRVARPAGPGSGGPPAAPGLLYSDEPTTTDQLDRRQYALQLARLAREARPPLVIGVYGEWGAGKTSLLRQVWAELDRQGGDAVLGQ
jgi:hypothetical protein